MIIRGGYNVYPREIEEVLLTHPAVSLAAVIGVPHETTARRSRRTSSSPTAPTVTEAELVAWAKEQMARLQVPPPGRVRPTLPMTATGKILKRELS